MLFKATYMRIKMIFKATYMRIKMYPQNSYFSGLCYRWGCWSPIRAAPSLLVDEKAGLPFSKEYFPRGRLALDPLDFLPQISNCLRLDTPLWLRCLYRQKDTFSNSFKFWFNLEPTLATSPALIYSCKHFVSSPSVEINSDTKSNCEFHYVTCMWCTLELEKKLLIYISEELELHHFVLLSMLLPFTPEIQSKALMNKGPILTNIPVPMHPCQCQGLAAVQRGGQDCTDSHSTHCHVQKHSTNFQTSHKFLDN